MGAGLGTSGITSRFRYGLHIRSMHHILRALTSSRLPSSACLLVVFLAGGASFAQGQELPVRRVNLVFETGSTRTIELGQAMSPDYAITEAMIDVQREGYLHAVLDSSKAVPGDELDLYINRGLRVLISEIRFSDDPPIPMREVVSILDLAPGDALDLNRLERGLEDLVLDLARRGHVLASVRISDIVLNGAGEDHAIIKLDFDPGPEALLRGFDVSGAERTRAVHIQRLLRLQPGMRIERFDALEIQRQLLQSGLFSDVGSPSLRIEADSVTIVLSVTEEESGSFDLAFGYQPSAAGAALVGSGHLALHNPFGGGRSFRLNLDRLPGQTSRFEAEAADPYFLGTPISVATMFRGYQQDSLFHRQHVGLEVGYQIRGGPEIFASGTLERSRPGVAGFRIEGGRQRIARSDLRMLGSGIRLHFLDYARNPSRGIIVEATAERGLNRRSQTRIVDADTTREHRAVRQDRATLLARSYLPLGAQGVIVTGIDLHALLSDEYDRSYFIRIGGLRTLRGYDDDQFLVRLAGRGIAEYRHRLDRLSYLLAFVDLAYLERPQLHDIDGFQAWRTGFGIGAQFDTGFSLMNVVLAANPTDGITTPRIHAGISFGL